MSPNRSKHCGKARQHHGTINRRSDKTRHGGAAAFIKLDVVSAERADGPRAANVRPSEVGHAARANRKDQAQLPSAYKASSHWLWPELFAFLLNYRVALREAGT
jgi:hypothetical protein